MSHGVRYAPRAEDDLDDIALFTRDKWSGEQAIRYLDQLAATCAMLFESPGIGRRCDYLVPGLKRVEVGSHVIFFLEDERGILVVRIRHKSEHPRSVDFS